MERGIRVGTGRHVFQKELARLAAEGAVNLSPRVLLLVTDMASGLDAINNRVAAIDAEIKALARTDADMLRLMERPWEFRRRVFAALHLVVGQSESAKSAHVNFLSMQANFVPF